MLDYDLNEDGFTILRSVFKPDHLNPLCELLNALVEQYANTKDDPFEEYYLNHRTDQGVLYDLYQRHPEFTELARNPTIINSLKKTLGNNIFLYENSLVYKPHGKKNGVPFHQDFISRPNEPIKFIAWTALENINKSSGSLKILPKSHKQGFRPWRRVKGETHHDRIDETDINPNDVIYIELNQGDVLIFNQLTIHGSDLANTENMRYAYRASYQNFEEIYTPRATPLVVSGNNPESIHTCSYKIKNRAQSKSSLTLFINKIGRFLSRV